MVDRKKIEERIAKDNQYPFLPNYVKTFADLIEKNYIPEVEENILEWAEGRPFSEIPVGDWSVKRLFEEFPRTNIIEVLEGLKEYKEAGFKNDLFLERFYKSFP